MRALYRASQRGVTIDLIVRDTCRLRPGLDGVSADDQGRQRSSAASSSTAASTTSTTAASPSTTSARRTRCSATSRSASRCCVPIEDPRLQAELRHILDTQLADQRGAWDMQPDGSYVQRTGAGAKHSQQQLIERTERRLKEATRLRRRKVQAVSRKRK